MKFEVGPSIVRDGLVLYLDAGNIASYTSGSNTWYDLIGVNNGTLTNGPTFDTGSNGSIVFDGSNDYVNQTLNTGSFTTEATLIMFLKLTNATPSDLFQTGIERLSAYLGHQASHYPWTDGTAYLSTFQTGGIRVDSISLSSTIDRTNWHMITITSSPGANNWKFYQNLDLRRSATGSDTVVFSSDGVYNLGRSQSQLGGNLFYLNGNIATIQLYNKALTEVEITQNYNALKSRFSL